MFLRVYCTTECVFWKRLVEFVCLYSAFAAHTLLLCSCIYCTNVILRLTTLAFEYDIGISRVIVEHSEIEDELANISEDVVMDGGAENGSNIYVCVGRKRSVRNDYEI